MKTLPKMNLISHSQNQMWERIEVLFMYSFYFNIRRNYALFGSEKNSGYYGGHNGHPSEIWLCPTINKTKICMADMSSFSPSEVQFVLVITNQHCLANKNYGHDVCVYCMQIPAKKKKISNNITFSSASFYLLLTGKNKSKIGKQKLYQVKL